MRKHAEETGSAVAEGLLADWAASVERFGKVMPKDYKRVLEAQAAAVAEGLDTEATLRRVMEARA